MRRRSLAVISGVAGSLPVVESAGANTSGDAIHADGFEAVIRSPW